MNSRKSKRRRHGISTVWIVLTVLLLVAIVGVATDTGYAVLVANQLQNAADAAALAGAQWVKSDIDYARQAAVDMAAENYAANAPVLLKDVGAANEPNDDIFVGRFDRDARVFTPTLRYPNAVMAIARRTQTSLNGSLPLLFGSIFGVDTIDVSRHAIAMVGGGTGAGNIVLAPTGECTFEVAGTILLDVESGAIQVNSNDPCAVCGNGTPLLDTPDLNIVGDPGACFVGGVEVTGTVNPNSPYIPDPLAFLPPPTWDEADDLGTFIQTEETVTVIEPGYYSGGITQLGGSLTLQPGIYILDGVGLEVGGNSSFIADGVMLYITGTGFVDIDGTGLIRITPPDPELHDFPEVGTYEGVSIFQARAPGGEFNENGGCHDSRIIGTGLLEMGGTLYFPCAHLEIGGIGGDFGNQLISYTLALHGTGQIRIAYDGTLNAPGNNLFLVQ